MKIILWIISGVILLSNSSCCVFKGDCALKINPQKDSVAVDKIFESIQIEYYKAVKELNERFVGINLQNCTVSLSNVYTATTSVGLKFFVAGASYQHSKKNMSTISFALSPPPPPSTGNKEKNFVNPNDVKDQFPPGSLADLIYKAAMAFHETPNFGSLTDHSITIDNSFTSDNQGNLTVSVPIGSFTPNAQGTLDFQYGNEIKFQFSVCEMCDNAIGKTIAFDHGGTGCTLLSKSEFHALQLSRPTVNTRSYSKIPSVKILNTPPINDQGKQNSCVGWAVGYTYLSTVLNKDGKNWTGENEMSPSFIYNQIQQGDCKPIRIQDALDLIATQGDCSMDSMQYNSSSCTEQPKPAQLNQASQNIKKIGKWYTVNPNSIDDIKNIISAGQPVIVGLQITKSFENMWASGGNWTANCTCGQTLGGHCVCIIGYDDNKKMLKVQNQWGDKSSATSTQGDHGYIWVSYDLVERGCFTEAYAFEN